jgi:hypothetical protein
MATGRFRDYQALNLLSIVHLNGPAFVAGNVNAIRFGPNQSGLSAPIIAVPNGAFTMLVVGRRTSGGDFMNITDGTTNWWHGDALVSTADLLTDDDGVAGSNSTVITTPASTDLWAAISSCPASGTAETFYFRNITQNTGGGALTGAANGGCAGRGVLGEQQDLGHLEQLGRTPRLSDRRQHPLPGGPGGRQHVRERRVRDADGRGPGVDV